MGTAVLAAHAAADCDKQDGSNLAFGLWPITAGVLVSLGVFLVTRSPLLRFLGVMAGIAAGLLVLFVAFGVAMGNCFEI